MAAKYMLVLCASALFVQSISAQCIGNALAAEELAYSGAYAPANLAYSSYNYGGYAPSCGYNAIAPTSGGGFPITSSSPISPTGITVISENAIEGALSIAGELPFLGAVALEGALPTAGAGGINYGCGGAPVAIVSEGIAPAYGPGIAPGRYGMGGFAAPGFAAPAFAGFPAGLAAPGLAAPGLAAPGLAAPGCGAGLAGPGFGYNGLPGYGFGGIY